MPAFKKMNIGDKFNHLTVIDDNVVKLHGRNAYLFKCDCGKEKIINASDVRSGHTKTCGCKMGFTRVEDLTGQKFNRLTVLEFAGTNKSKQAQ